MRGFWKTWMTLWCLSVGLFGVVLALGGLEATDAPVRWLFMYLNGPGDLEIDGHMRFCLAVMGPVTMGWSVTLLAACSAANKLNPHDARRLWIGITLGVLCWFTIDSALSVATGFWRNTIPNSLYLLAYLAPVLSTGVMRKTRETKEANEK